MRHIKKTIIHPPSHPPSMFPPPHQPPPQPHPTSHLRPPHTPVEFGYRLGGDFSESLYAGYSARADDEVRALHDALFGGGREKIERPSLRRLPGPPVRTEQNKV